MWFVLLIIVYYLDEDEMIFYMIWLFRMVLDGYCVKIFLDLLLSVLMNGII